MTRESLLIDFELARVCQEAPIESQIKDLKHALEIIVSNALPECAGVKEASWTLQCGVEVSITSADRIGDSGYTTNMLASTYEIAFRRYHGDVADQDNYTELVYEICIPAPGSIAVPSAWRKKRYVNSDEEFAAEANKLFLSPHLKPEYTSLSERYIAELADDADSDESLEKLSVNDLVMLANVLTQTIDFQDDPFSESGDSILNGAPADNKSVAAFQNLLESVTDRGMSKFTKVKRVPIKLIDPNASAYLSIYLDDSEYGDLAFHAKRSIRPEFTVTIVIQTDEVTHKLQFICSLDGTLACTSSMDMSPLERINPIVGEVMRRILESDTSHFELKSMGLNPDLDRANQSQLEFFSRLVEELVN